MIFIGLVAGTVLGALMGGMPGALVGGFAGFIVALVIDARRKPKRPIASVPEVESLEARVARLERQVAELLAVAPAKAGALPQEVTPARAGAQASPEAVVEAVEEAPQPEPPPAIEPPPAAPPAPPRPNPIVAWLTGGNTIARVGLVILFIGLAFLLKYAADHAVFPIEVRVATVAAFGIVMLGLGWRWRRSKPGYALGLQGGGVAVLYLTTFGAFRLWSLIPPEAAFGLLAGIAVFSAILAVKQDSLALAAFGASGGFMAPILASTGGGSHVALFGYYLLLNLGIAAIAWHKAWRPLNLLGFAFTFLIGLAWGWRFYRPESFASTEPFLVAFFLLYVAIAVLYARKQEPSLRHFVDGTLVFGNPLAAFGLQAALLKGNAMALAFSALGVAALYIVLAAVLKRSRTERYGLLGDAFLALGVAFATAAIPLALDARWTSAAWAVEGAAIVWIGVRQKRWLARLFGLLLQPLAAAAYVDGFGLRTRDALPLLQPNFIGALLIAVAGIVAYRQLARCEDKNPWERALVPIVFAWGLVWWLAAGAEEIDRVVPMPSFNAIVAFVAATAALLAWLGVRRDWREAALATRLYMPALIFLALVAGGGLAHPFAAGGWLAWPFAIAVHFWVLRVVSGEGAPLARFENVLHAAGMLLVAALAARELHWIASTFTARHTAWSAAALGFAPALVLLVASLRSFDQRRPILDHAEAYRRTGALVIAVALAAWSLVANVWHDGSSQPLPYVPLLNALDLAHVFAGLALAFAWRAWHRSSGAEPQLPDRTVLVLGGVVVFLWLNGVLLRTLHHWWGVPYTFDGITRSVLAQAALSVFWAVLALAAMLHASRSARRWLWMVGGGLMAVVVVKLLAIDLARLSGVERIVSFIAVGVLMLVIGYVSPVPPKAKEAS